MGPSPPKGRAFQGFQEGKGAKVPGVQSDQGEIDPGSGKEVPLGCSQKWRPNSLFPHHQGSSSTCWTLDQPGHCLKARLPFPWGCRNPQPSHMGRERAPTLPDIVPERPGSVCRPHPRGLVGSLRHCGDNSKGLFRPQPVLSKGLLSSAGPAPAFTEAHSGQGESAAKAEFKPRPCDSQISTLG